MVQVEAMATGTPVVTLRRGSAPEVVADGETGFIVDSIDQLPSALHRVSELDPLACRRRVEKNFDVSVMAAGYEELYARAADRWRPARAA
jgi:glycosyltransferase involved in cell wall biosynthesis